MLFECRTYWNNTHLLGVFVCVCVFLFFIQLWIDLFVNIFLFFFYSLSFTIIFISVSTHQYAYKSSLWGIVAYIQLNLTRFNSKIWWKFNKIRIKSNWIYADSSGNLQMTDMCNTNMNKHSVNLENQQQQ